MQLWNYTDRFVRERKILNNVSTATADWYHYSLKAFKPVLEAEYQSIRELRTAVVTRIGELRGEGRGNKGVSVNTYLRCLKAFLNWCFEEQIVKERVKLSWLKEEEKVLAPLRPEHIKRLVDYKPVQRSGMRLRAIILTALDTGLRLNELLGMLRNDVDFDNFCLRVKGKGNKERLIPMSVELRKILYRHLASHEYRLVFCTLQGKQMSKRNLLRDFKELAGLLGITGVRCSLHTCRHSFAVNYLRAGGNVLYLQRILGHTSLEMTNRYCRSLGIDDLKAVHNGLSLLSR